MELISGKIIAPLQKQVDELRRIMNPLDFEYYRRAELREGKNVIEIDFYKGVIQQLKKIEEEVFAEEKRHNFKTYAIFDSIKEAMAIAEKHIKELTQNRIQELSLKKLESELNTDTGNESRYDYDYSKALKNYQFWQANDKKKQGYVNIFEGISEREFFEMINHADFSKINKKRISQRVKRNIAILSRLLGNEWGEEAAKKINDTLFNCKKMTGFPEWDDLKSMYSQ